jgi:hypothetical protein
MARSTPLQFKCSICDMPLDLRTCKTDDHGQAVHEECYVLKEQLKGASKTHFGRFDVPRVA